MTAKLYAMPASHPSMAVALMLERKGIEFRTVWLLLPFTGLILRLVGFPRRTVPALRVDGRRIQGSRVISAAIEELEPEPPLFLGAAGSEDVEPPFVGFGPSFDSALSPGRWVPGVGCSRFVEA